MFKKEVDLTFTADCKKVICNVITKVIVFT
jgi:hypothetical protein